MTLTDSTKKDTQTENDFMDAIKAASDYIGNCRSDAPKQWNCLDAKCSTSAPAVTAMCMEYPDTTSLPSFWYEKTGLPSVSTPQKADRKKTDWIEDVFGMQEKKKEVDLHSTMDAQVWAKEFCRVFKEIHKFDLDEEWVFGWMANSIMCGYDTANSRNDKKYIYVFLSGSGEVINVFSVEPDERELDNAYARYLDTPYDESFKGVGSRGTTLVRYSKYTGVETWNGKSEDTLYKWKGQNIL